MADDTAPIREDERFDEKRVAAYLRDELPDLVGDHPIEFDQFPGGAANLTYRARSGDSEFVLRRAPHGPIAKGGHDMKREHRVLSRLWKAYPKAPRSFHYCADPEVMGKPFFFMERRRGWVIRAEWPGPFAAEAALRRRLAESLVDSLAELHLVDPGAVGLGDLGQPEGFVARQVEGWSRRWAAARTRDVPDMEVAARLLGSVQCRFCTTTTSSTTLWLRIAARSWPSSIGTWQLGAIPLSIWGRCSPTGPIQMPRPFRSSATYRSRCHRLWPSPRLSNAIGRQPGPNLPGCSITRVLRFSGSP